MSSTFPGTSGNWKFGRAPRGHHAQTRDDRGDDRARDNNRIHHEGEDSVGGDGTSGGSVLSSRIARALRERWAGQDSPAPEPSGHAINVPRQVHLGAGMKVDILGAI